MVKQRKKMLNSSNEYADLECYSLLKKCLWWQSGRYDKYNNWKDTILKEKSSESYHLKYHKLMEPQTVHFKISPNGMFLLKYFFCVQGWASHISSLFMTPFLPSTIVWSWDALSIIPLWFFVLPIMDL